MNIFKTIILIVSIIFAFNSCKKDIPEETETKPYKLVSSWGVYGTDSNQLLKPNLIVAFGDYIFINDDGVNKIKKFDEDGNFISELGFDGDIDIDYFYIFNDFLYIVNPLNTTQISKYDLDFNFIQNYTFSVSLKNMYDHIYGIAGNDKQALISFFENEKPCLKNVNFTNLEIVEFGALGIGNLQFNEWARLNITYDNNLYYIADEGNKRVQIVDTNSTYVNEISTVDKLLNGPSFIAFTNDQIVLAAGYSSSEEICFYKKPNYTFDFSIDQFINDEDSYINYGITLTETKLFVLTQETTNMIKVYVKE